MILFGVDPGLTRCGVGVVDAGPGRQVSFRSVHVLRSPAGEDPAIRLRTIGEGLAELLDQERPEGIALERVFAQNNLSTVMGTAQVSGVVMFLAAQRGIPVTMVTPSELKAQITGYGNADKAQVTHMVTRVLGLAEPPKPADAADALALAVTHAWRSFRSPRSAPGGDASGMTPAQLAWQRAERAAKRPGGRGGAR